VIEGNRHEAVKEMTVDIKVKLQELRASGMPAKEAIAAVSAETGLSRKELYRAWLEQT
jgi:16S rRNA C1402 (ribose-2'-O) methylase RsmI